jgi:glutamyl-tRNA(Gln) amidotransferase subunit D
MSNFNSTGMKSPEIHVVTTGGTIESISGTESVSLDGSGRLERSLQKLASLQGARVSTSSPMKKLSENMTPVDWILLSADIKAAYERNIRSIVVTHGTDTMAFSVAAISTLREFYPEARICFTGSYLPPDEEGSDWTVNFQAALGCVVDDRIDPGVYVSFRSDSSNVGANIISSGNLKPMNFDSLTFEASFDRYAAHWQSGSVTKVAPNNMTQCLTICHPRFEMIQDNIETTASKVCLVETHPGMDFSKTARFIAEYEVAIFALYHSGTGPSYPSKRGLIDLLRSHSRKTKCVFGVYPSAYISVPYDSTREIVTAGGLVVKDLQPYHLYTYLVLGLSSGLDLQSMLNTLPLLAD